MPAGKFLIIAGLVLVAVGLLVQFGPAIPLLGKLPGDLRIEKKNVSFYAPLASCLLLSIVVSLLFWLFRK